MLIIRLLRFLKGYVCFRAEGGFCERFVNLCTLRKIPLWDLRRQKDCLYAVTTVEGYKSIRFPASRSGARVRIIKKCGLPFFFNRNRQRRGLLIGIVASALIILLLSGMVWDITVEGNSRLSEEQVLQAFSAQGVKIGARKSKINPSEAEDGALKALPELLWANVNIKGSRVEIIIKERTDAPEFPDTETPCNIVAAEDAEIVSVNEKIGVAQVQAGDLVLKGDLLISGVVENADRSSSLKSARGEVYAVVRRGFSSDGCKEVFKKNKRTVKRYSLNLLGIEIPLGFKPQGEYYYKSSAYLSDENVVLPLGVTREHSYILENAEALSPSAERLYCLKNYALFYMNNAKSSEIKSSRFSLRQTESGTYISDTLTVVCDIGKRSEIFIEN